MRRAWVVVLLAVVFLMHGVPATAQHSVPSPHVEMSADLAGPDGAGTRPVAVMAQPAAAHGAEQADHGTSSHSTASHAWNACLAVLLVGMALLVALAVRRRPALPDYPAALRLRGSGACTAPLRPPELSALCVLRT